MYNVKRIVYDIYLYVCTRIYTYMCVCVYSQVCRGFGSEERKLAGELREDKRVCHTADKGSGSGSELV